MRSLALASAILAAATASAGCAVIGAKAPDPDRPRDQPPMCNDGKGGVVVDALMATTFGITTLALASDDAGGPAAITGLAALAYGISAAAGNSSANKCRAAMEEFVAMREREAAETAFAREHAATPGAIGGLAIAPEDEDDEDQPAASIPRPQPQPAPQPQPPAKSKPAPAKRAPAADTGGDDGDWSEFWKEVP